MPTLSRADILPLDVYASERSERRQRITSLKKSRRVSVGPDITFYFENFDTMLHQIHEMLHIERGGEAQIADELRAYAPLVPDGRSLVATMMIEIDDPARRARVLGELGGIEESISLTFGGETVKATPETDTERTTADGKTSSVHFLKFHFTDSQAAAFSKEGTRVILCVGHPRYDHMAAVPETTRRALAEDFA